MADENTGTGTTASQAEASGGTQGGFAGTGGDMAEGLRTAGERMRAAGEQVAGQGSELGLKMLDQAESNAREAFRMMRAAAQAKDMTDVMRLQSEFLREQSNRSIAQAREIGEMIASFGRAAVGQMTSKP